MRGAGSGLKGENTMFGKSLFSARLLAVAICAAIAAGCATGARHDAPRFRDARSPAWSLSASNDDMKVAVSPARRTLQIAGSSGFVVGLVVDAVANRAHAKRLREALGDYDAGVVFEGRLAERLADAFPRDLRRVGPDRANAKGRYASLAMQGRDAVLDLKMTYGIFGAGGTLTAKLKGRATALPKGRRTWNNTLVVCSAPVLASDALCDPTKRLAPNFKSPRLSAKDDAIAQWTKDQGQPLRSQFGQTVEGAVSALLCDLGIVEEALGEYYLGKNLMNRKKYAAANAHFNKAVRLDPYFFDARNARAVNIARNKQVPDAIAMTRALVKDAPGYGPAWYNLAWWYAIKNKDPNTARPYYRKAIDLGMPPSKRIEKALLQGE